MSILLETSWRCRLPLEGPALSLAWRVYELLAMKVNAHDSVHTCVDQGLSGRWRAADVEIEFDLLGFLCTLGNRNDQHPSPQR